MITFEVEDEQVEEIIESIDELEEGEQWEPGLSFSYESAMAIRRDLEYQKRW